MHLFVIKNDITLILTLNKKLMNLTSFKKNLFVHSLRTRIVLLTCGATFITAMVIGGLNYFRTIEITMNKATESLAAESRLASISFQGKYDEIRNDALITSRMPPISGIIRSIRNNGIDPDDHTITASWQKRLTMIFSSIMKDRQHYKQMQFIGIENNGLELASVYRLNHNLISAIKGDLKTRAEESYFKEVLEDDDYNDVHLSEVTYGKDEILLMRATHLIYYKNKLFGMLVITIDYDKMFFDAFQEIKLRKDAFVLSNNGNHMQYYKDKGNSDLKFHHEDLYSELLNKFHLSKETEMTGIVNDQVFYGVKLRIDESDKSRSLGVILKVSKQELMHEVYEVRNQNIILGAVVLILTLLTTIITTNKLTRPLKKMTKEVSLSKRGQILDLPIDLKDEIGELARAFKKKAEDLFTSEKKMSTIMNNIVDGIITVNKNNKIDSYSDVCNSIFGYSIGDVLGKDFNFLLKKDRSKKEKEIDDLSKKTCDLIAIRKDGSEFSLEMSVNKIALNSSNLYCCVVRDVSAIRKVEAMKNEFISTVNHEIRTPLTSIKGSIGLLRMKMIKSLEEKERKLLNISYDNCERLECLVNDILDIEKIAAGKMDYDFEIVEICRVVKNAVEASEGYAKKYNIEFIIKNSIEEVNCEIDVNRFIQALNNLLSNAAKFSHQDGKVTISVSKFGKSKVKISVSDEGDGIPLSFQDKIFQRFSQADSSSIRKKGGTGLGLSIAKSIIKDLKGEIGFDSKSGVGTTFYMILEINK